MKHLVAGLVVVLAAAPAWAVDAKKLARFDAGFAQCEARNPEMKGHADDAFLSLWRIPPTAKAHDDLAAARKSRAYKAEHSQAAARLAKDTSPETARKLGQQCQATWAETKRASRVAPAASAASR